MEKKLISLNQIEVLINKFLKDNAYKEHFVIYDLEVDDLWSRLGKMTEKQYNYIKILVSQKKWFTIKEILDKFLKHK